MTEPSDTPMVDAVLAGWTDRVVSQSRLIPADDYAALRDVARQLERKLGVMERAGAYTAIELRKCGEDLAAARAENEAPRDG